ncbi:MAG: chemotaxis protein CheW, partial [Anaerolineae bacterium]|nr:chemotaxis protein CheW [Anaerolineae bacterium]
MTFSASEHPHDETPVERGLAVEDLADEGQGIKQRLQQRARLYAAPNQRIEIAPENVLTVLTFELGSEHYGVDVMKVRGVRTISRITRVPGTPNFYRGVV